MIGQKRGLPTENTCEEKNADGAKTNDHSLPPHNNRKTTNTKAFSASNIDALDTCENVDQLEVVALQWTL